MRNLVVCSLLTLLWCAQATADDVLSNPLIFPGEQGNGYNPAYATPWIQTQAKVPGLPKNGDLTQLSVEHLPQGFHLYADFKHVQVGKQDLVIRTWFVLRSDQGSYNGTYEGFRCGSGEYEIYAYGDPDASKPVRLVKSPKWRKVAKFGYRDSVLKDYLCNYGMPKTPSEMRESDGSGTTIINFGD